MRGSWLERRGKKQKEAGMVREEVERMREKWGREREREREGGGGREGGAS